MSVVPFERKPKDETDVPTEEQGPFLQGRCRCLACKHEWEAVEPVGVVDLECPSCGCLRGAWRNPIGPANGSIWRCDCGNDLFLVTQDGLMCGCCGVRAVFPY